MAAEKVDVCHRTVDGVWVKINIADQAFQTHVDHGDAAPGGEVPDDPQGRSFDENCVPVTASPTSSPSSSPTASPSSSPTPCPDLFCRRRLRDGEEVPVKEDYSIPEVLELIEEQKDYGASADATFYKRYNLISKESCDALVDYVDKALERDLASGKSMPVGRASDGMEDLHESWASFEDGGVDNQYSKKIYADELVKMIGPEEAKNIIDFFEESLGGLTIDCMYLARHAEPKEHFYVVPWHTDNYSTVEITLNDDYEGGDVLHLNKDGVHKTNAEPGSATAHGADIVHGITPNIGGAKYMLILKHHHERPDKVGVVRINKAMVDEIAGTSFAA